MNESEYMKEAEKLLCDYGTACLEGPWLERCKTRDALLSHIAKGEQARAECGNTPYDEGPFTLEQARAVEVPDAAAKRDYCPEKLKPGGCQLHNLHCGFPKCNEPASPTTAGQQAAPADWTDDAACLSGLADRLEEESAAESDRGNDSAAVAWSCRAYELRQIVSRMVRSNAGVTDRGQQAGGGEDGKHCQVQVIHLTDQQREMLSAKGVTHIPGRADSAAGTGLSAAIDRTSAAGRCDLCKGTGIADLPDPWGGVTGTCPDCNGTGGPADADAPIPAEVGRRALEALKLTRAAIEPLTEAQIKLHLIRRDTADKADAAITELQQALEKS